MKCHSQQSTTPKRKAVFQIYIFCQVIEFIYIYRPTISFHENNQFVQGWTLDITIKIKILKIRFNDFQKYIENNNK